jgi:hypothetical protein
MNVSYGAMSESQEVNPTTIRSQVVERWSLRKQSAGKNHDDNRGLSPSLLIRVSIRLIRIRRKRLERAIQQDWNPTISLEIDRLIQAEEILRGHRVEGEDVG